MKTIIQKLRSDLIDELRKQVFRNRTIVSGKYTEAEGHTGGNKTILWHRKSSEVKGEIQIGTATKRRIYSPFSVTASC